MFIGVDGHMLNTVEFGSGSATFVAHGGWVGNWELWQEPFQLMQSRWRCVSYDHRGSGASSFPPDAIGPAALVDDVFRVLDHHGIASCVLAGESLGALTCLQAVARDPSRFDGLVLVDGAPAASEEGAAPLVMGSRADYPATVHAFVDACVPEPDSEHVRRWGRQILLRADLEAAARILESHYEERVAADLTQISPPTLVIHGENDNIIPVQVAETVAVRYLNPRAAARARRWTNCRRRTARPDRFTAGVQRLDRLRSGRERHVTAGENRFSFTGTVCSLLPSAFTAATAATPSAAMPAKLAPGNISTCRSGKGNGLLPAAQPATIRRATIAKHGAPADQERLGENIIHRPGMPRRTHRSVPRVSRPE